MAEYWMADAERVHKGWFLIGEDDNGDLCVPTREFAPDHQFPTEDARVWKRMNPRNPLHWLRVLSSRLQMRVVWLENS